LAFYEPEEYRGARVYDSLGLLYGVVCGFEASERVALKACMVVESEAPVPDVERLRSMLLERGAEAPAEAGVEALVAAARRLGLEIPYRAARGRVELVKGLVEPSEIAVVDRVEDGSLVVLLSTEREARFRGLTRRDLPRPRPVDALGKPAISLSRGYLGLVEKLVIGPGAVGLRAVKKSGPYLAWFAYLRRLEEKGLRRLAEKLAAEVADPLAERRLPAQRLGEVKEALRRLGAPPEAERILDEALRYERLERVDVEWGIVRSVADAVVTE